jgi:hypothetical protein
MSSFGVYPVLERLARQARCCHISDAALAAMIGLTDTSCDDEE